MKKKLDDDFSLSTVHKVSFRSAECECYVGTECQNLFRNWIVDIIFFWYIYERSGWTVLSSGDWPPPLIILNRQPSNGAVQPYEIEAIPDGGYPGTYNGLGIEMSRYEDNETENKRLLEFLENAFDLAG